MAVSLAGAGARACAKGLPAAWRQRLEAGAPDLPAGRWVWLHAVSVGELLLAEGLVGRLRDQTLNDLPQFEGLNPSIEHLARLFCQSFTQRIQAANLSRARVQIWENEIAWSSYEQTITP